MPILAGLLLGAAWLSVSLYFLIQAGTADSIRMLADEVRIDLLESRRREKDVLLRSLNDPDFYARGTATYLEEYLVAANRLGHNAELLAGRIPADWPINLQPTVVRIHEYTEHFVAFVACHRRLGFGEFGLEGACHSELVALEKSVQATGNPALQICASRLRGDEKEYLFRHNFTDFDEGAGQLRELIRQSKPDSAAQLNAGLDRVLSRLDACREVAQEIGLSENRGLYGKFRAAAHDIEPGVLEVVGFATRRYGAATRRLMTGMAAASLLLMTLLSVTFFLTRSARVRSRHLGETAAELSRSNAELQQFAYVASHDLQEPLRAVVGCVQLLQQRAQGKLDEKCDELIRHAVEGSIRMQTLIEDLLTLSRVGTGVKPFETVDSGQVLQAALDNLAVPIRESGATITHDVLPRVSVDPTQIMQVFQNLVGNSLKFRASAPPVVHVAAQKVGDRWRFSVKDNGIGIEPQYFEKIFQIFQRLHTRREYPGSGIGLALCRKILVRHGGEIWLESQLNRGTTFYFTLPDGVEDA